MNYHLLHQDNLAVVSDLTELSVKDILAGKGTIPESSEDILGDVVVFKLLVDGEPSSHWHMGRLATVDPMSEGIPLDNIDHVFYHRFPNTSYIYIPFEGAITRLTEDLDLPGEDQYEVIYPPILIFPEGLPATPEELCVIDIWLATSGEHDEEKEYVEIAKVHRSYSYNYVNSMLDFSNLPDYKE